MKNKILNIGLAIFAFIAIFSCTKSKEDIKVESPKTEKVKEKILFVVTSHDTKGDTGEKTGFYLGEASHPWEVLKDDYEIDFVSPKGGKAPVDGFDLNDAVNKEFWENKEIQQKIANTMKPSDINSKDYVAIHYVGGHGAMWDFADNLELAKIASEIYEKNGIVSAVCHGPAGIVNIKLSDGKYLVDGKKVNGFTNEEEEAVKLTKIVPFLLEDKLKERGGIFEKSPNFTQHVTVDGRLITGQNPQSARGVGEAIRDALAK
ncbi:type 1 glutamine amidotransferase domain-containing protein [Moheibacter sediminis]|uniref:Putative intracellular protease/amidase n=1 Tax=Moheibacter sediminis TaxID=1434700 RepID=A0A1W2ASR8_9FLAO|nr:type 1 glutamine amidotransferase domain-containing protein [Moheibacter sediminis]SMC63634.1 Putative intracellular protease/amidase [Moheibacter sediminis]